MVEYCKHPTHEIRKKLASNGRPMVGPQCLTCGHAAGDYLKKADWPESCPPWDDALKTAYAERYAAAIRAEREEKNQAWWSKYNEYLRSPKWASKRRTVLARDLKCQACLRNDSTQVHHKTYEHVFDEPLFDLVGVCAPCHDLITDIDRKRRASAL